MDVGRARSLLRAERSRVENLLKETTGAGEEDRSAANEPGDLSDRDVAVIFHLETEGVEHCRQACRPQRRRPHQGSPLRRADLDGRAKQRDSPRQI